MVMLTDAWKPLRFHPIQDQLWRTKARFFAVAAGRGSGKTELMRRRIVRMLPVKISGCANPIYAFAAPTVPQAKKLGWTKIIDLIPPQWVKSINHTDMHIRTVFGSEFYALGMDRPMRAEGVQYCGVVIDESSDQKASVFRKTFLPALSTYSGWCGRIGVPKRHGIGAIDFKEFFDNINGDGAQESYTWRSSDILSAEEIALHKRMLDEKDFNEQYNASWESATGKIFHAFGEHNVSTDAEYNPNLPIFVGSDFNVNPMSWCIGHIIDDKMYVFDEIFLRDTNTERTLDVLFQHYGKHKAGWEFYGDATAASRKTSATQSDYIQIKNDKRFIDAKVFYTKSNPLFKNRVAACNAMFRNAAQQVRTFLNPRCKRTINDLTIRAWKDNGLEADDSGDIGHSSDAIGYPIYFRFPLRLDEPEINSRISLESY